MNPFPADGSERDEASRESCGEGVSLQQAWESQTVDAQRRTDAEFADARHDDRRAASYLQAFTGLVPHWRDRHGLQGAVDIVLRSDAGLLEVVEITSTLDAEYERERRRMERLVARVQVEYSGPSAWLLHLRYGWATPATNASMNRLATQIASELIDFDAKGRHADYSKSTDWLYFRRDFDDTTPRVAIASWSANIPEIGNEPYLDRLSRFLSGSKLIGEKTRKLKREAITLCAPRRHLYLMMASMGDEGGLLPLSRSYLSGAFIAPAGLTDIWLDGGFGEIYHWVLEAGWTLHRLRPDWRSSDIYG